MKYESRQEEKQWNSKNKIELGKKRFCMNVWNEQRKGKWEEARKKFHEIGGISVEEVKRRRPGGTRDIKGSKKT